MQLPPAGGIHDDEEIEAVVQVLRTSNLELGASVAALEAGVAGLLAKHHGVLVNSGSSALRLAIDLLDLEPGDEIITSPLTFSTDIAPMVQSSLIPVFVDITPDTFQIDVDALAAAVGPRTRAILVPNLCGNVPDWDAIRAVADEHGLPVVEDSCDVLDSWLRERRTGTRSDISVTSFARSHAMTAGGNGGLVGLDDDDLHDRCLSLRRWGRRSESYLFGSRRGRADRFGELADGTPYDLVFVFDEIGYNFEPSELGAAYGLVQLGKLDRFNDRRRSNWQRLEDLFEGRAGITTGRTTEGARTTWMRYCVLIEDDAPFTRTQVQEFLVERGVETRMVWTGNVLRQPGFAKISHRIASGGLPNCDRVMDTAMSLPIHHGLGDDHMDFICEQLDELFAHYA
jgi:CDP-6-deoxy-D-xylo-4-hexulose-3-dehydrase